MSKDSIDDKLIGKRLINNAINMDESLEEILRVEVKRLKQLAKDTANFEELQKTRKIIKNIIIALMITDEKLRMGIDLYSSCNENEEL